MPASRSAWPRSPTDFSAAYIRGANRILNEEADDYTLYYHNLARLAHKSSRFDLVAAAYQNALKVNPSDDVARVHLDRELRECAELEVIISEDKQRLFDAPDDIQIRYNLAHNYLGLGYIAEAKAEWERIAAMEQENWSKTARKMIRKHCGSLNDSIATE